jgi:pimeloyl-[acyl-carrier protein] synthase
MTLTEHPEPVAPVIDLFAPSLIEDPYPWYAEMRNTGPVDYTLPQLPNLRASLLSSHADVQAVLRDPRFGREAFQQAVTKALGEGPLADSYALWFLFMDPPNHTRLRGLVSKAFTPRTVERLRPQIEKVVEDLLDRQADKPSFDLVTAYAYQVPVLVICDLLGVPGEDRGRFGAWSAALARGLDNLSVTDSEFIMHGNAAAAGLTEYFRQLIRMRRRQPRSDLLSGLIAAEEAGDHLSEDELIATCVLLFFAGHETTVNLIGNGMLALLRYPRELKRLRDDLRLIGGAIEELLRYDSPVQRTGRVAAQDLELNGRFYRKGDRVNLLVGAANRDPKQFAEADRLDITRANASQHLSFAAGIHYCVGAPLARLEAQIAIAALLRRAPELRLLDHKLNWRPTFVLRGLQSLEVAWQ